MATPDRPILFAKVGAFGAEPLHFFDKLAEEYNADLWSSDEIRMELCEGRDKLSFSRSMTQVVNRTLEEGSRESLARSVNVVYDSALNARHRRAAIREEVVMPSGALMVTLCLQAPVEVIEDRVQTRYRHDELTIPSRLWDLSPVRVARMMLGGVEWPINGEEPHLQLNGQDSEHILFESIASYVADLRATET